jgi:DNA-binding transcriptional ArsR family regulator
VTPKIADIDDPSYVKALRHPLRVRILARLQERTASPVELAEQLQSTLGSVAYHVRTLHQLGLIELVRERPVRGATQHYYRAVERATIPDDAWREAAPIAKQAVVGATLQNIDEYTRAAAAAAGFDRDEAHLSRTALRLDARGWSELSKACERLLEQARRIEDSARRRIERDPHADGITDVGLVLMAFEMLRLSDIEPPAGDAQGRRARGGARGRQRVA